MFQFATRAGRWPLALTVVLLGACVDEPVAPTLSKPATPNAAAGDVFVVTNANDNGIGSLRWSLGFATGGETIRFDPSLGGQTIVLDSSLYIRKLVTIEGPANGGITLDGPGDDRAIWARLPGLVTLRNLTVTGTNAEGGAGVIYSEGSLTLENVTLRDNTAGGGIAVVADTIVLTNSTVSGTKLDTPTTFNHPAVFGSLVVVTNSTIAHNEWGGIGSSHGQGRVVIRNSVIANNGGKNCVLISTQFGTPTLERHGANVSDDDTCGGPTEIIITGDAKLGPLANNGGPAMTHALLAGSPAINTGTGCTVQVDQRYAPRDAQCDLGAYEFVDFTTVTITFDQNAAVNAGNGWATLTGTVKCSRAETFSLALELHQNQRIGKDIVDVHSAVTEPVVCDTTTRPWSASMVLSDGQEFKVSATATASAVTYLAKPWVAQAEASQSVKLYRKK